MMTGLLENLQLPKRQRGRRRDDQHASAKKDESMTTSAGLPLDIRSHHRHQSQDRQLQQLGHLGAGLECAVAIFEEAD